MIDGKLAREAAALVGFAQLDVGAIFLVLDGELCEARTRRADGGALMGAAGTGSAGASTGTLCSL